VSFAKGLEQHIEGVLTHGHGLTIYRTFPTVSADADLAIYAILNELFKWQDNHPNKQFPEIWYIQIDGGSENANKYLYATLEYLVYKRICRYVDLL
jgi:hypothetical protein